MKLPHVFSTIVCISLLLTQESNAAAPTAMHAGLPKNMPLNEMMFLSAHNIFANDQDGWKAYCQQMGNLEAQFKAGVRAGKVDLKWYAPQSKKSQLLGMKPHSEQEPFMAMCHELASPEKNCWWTSLLQKSGSVDSAVSFYTQLKKLIDENPTEVFVLFLEPNLVGSDYNNAAHYSFDETVQKLEQDLYKSGLADCVYMRRDVAASNITWPTYGELYANNKRVIIFIDQPAFAEKSLYFHDTDKTFASTHSKRSLQDDAHQTCSFSVNEADNTALAVGFSIENSISKDSIKGKIPVYSLIAGMIRAINYAQGVPAEDDMILKPMDYDKMNDAARALRRIAWCEGKCTSGSKAMILSADFAEKGNLAQFVYEETQKRAEKYREATVRSRSIDEQNCKETHHHLVRFLETLMASNAL